ncbi:putative peptidylprolyl isomerase [Rosa chinensis]|uniref:Putative peptidylprolyl isomerase n=1 Tax=Rosa chinensis TaxID=74649 RepID=A0A2P6SER4_ROSCH|nr:uncharacterized protein LOC112197129 [Rosa chinensis]PRQ57160.1 putative peptidylprolyl isomerase [Rosa chinensis]
MGRRQNESDLGRFALLALLLMGAISCCMLYLFISMVLKPNSATFAPISELGENGGEVVLAGKEEGECCRGIEQLELWGDAVKWGAEFKVNSSKECCMACKDMCGDPNGPCLCDSWVFCGDREACGDKFGECWLKKQKDTLEPDRRDSGDLVMWTSGHIFGKGEGVVGLETEYGILRIKLFVDCAPHSVFYILELLREHYCGGCQFYRAESRGSFWDSIGNHVQNAPFGPPFGLVQGTLEAHGIIFKEIPREGKHNIRRGSVAWVGSGPGFFISLANHFEWKKAYTVFGSVLPEDMEIAERIAQLPTKQEVWSNIDVSVLERPVSLQFQRIKSNL